MYKAFCIILKLFNPFYVTYSLALMLTIILLPNWLSYRWTFINVEGKHCRLDIEKQIMDGQMKIVSQFTSLNCQFKLAFGDLATLPKEESVDVMVVSAFPGLHTIYSNCIPYYTQDTRPLL